jgi:hypothetical protein
MWSLLDKKVWDKKGKKQTIQGDKKMKAEQPKAIIYILMAFMGLLLSAPAFGEPNEPNKAPKIAKPSKEAQIEEIKAGKNYIATKVYSAQEDEEMLNLYKGLRVADVVDGMDKVGLKNIGTMSPDIHPLWKDTVHYTHRIQGIAVTVR